MKILVCSDTHGNLYGLEMALEQEKSIDMLIHCGDIEGQEHEIWELAGGAPCYMVAGNNDWSSDLPREIQMNVDRYKFWVCHGNRYMVSMGPERIRDEAEDRGVDVCLFGHTHKPVVDYRHGLTLMNPGSLTYPRQNGRKPSYGVITIDEDHKMRFGIRNVVLC